MPLKLLLSSDDVVDPGFFTSGNVASFQVGLSLSGVTTAASSGDVTAATSSTKFVSPLTLGKGQANGVPSLDGNARIPHSQLPFEAYGQRFSAASQSAMLSLTAQPGDSCLRSDDGNHTWLLVDSDPTQLGSWIRQTTTADAPVQSVNTQTGTVTITCASLGAALASDLSAHVANVANPHAVTKVQVGLGSVTNDAQVKRTEMGVVGGVATLGSNGLVPANQLPPGSGGTVPAATPSVPGVVQLAGDLAGTSAAPTVPALNSKVNTSDSRLSDSRTPTAHRSTHAIGGSDPLTPANIGAAPLNSAALTGAPTAPTAEPGTNTAQIATTAFAMALFSMGSYVLHHFATDADKLAASGVNPGDYACIDGEGNRIEQYMGPIVTDSEPSTDNANWFVIRNTINLNVENNQSDGTTTVSVNEIDCPQYATTNVGWVYEDSIAISSSSSFEVLVTGAGSSAGYFNIYFGTNTNVLVPCTFAFPVPASPRDPNATLFLS